MSTDIHALTGAYAVDGLDDLERARFERHLAECDDCRAEVESLREAASLLPETSAVAPPPALRDRVLAEIAAVRPLPPESDGARVLTGASPSRPPRRILAGLVAAAVALIVLGGAVATVWHPWADDTSDASLSATDAVLRADDAERVSTDLGNGVRATVVRSKSLDHAVVVTRNMPDAPNGYDYVLWFDHGGELEVDSAMPDGPNNTILMDGDAASADGVGITVEREGVLPSEPSDNQLAVLGFEQA